MFTAYKGKCAENIAGDLYFCVLYFTGLIKEGTFRVLYFKHGRSEKGLSSALCFTVLIREGTFRVLYFTHLSGKGIFVFCTVQG